ncbi:MAG: stage III sporulation protein AF [Syntrophomonadaceae bacterium]|jgi:stage III sporulation protein AF|nr:stage III sporulation protein AF [Syntrophomonadaceae bacterium]
MDMLADMVRNILVIVIITSFMELLLPDGTIKPFVRFVIGLFVIIAVLTQAAAVFDKSGSLPVTLWDTAVSGDAAASGMAKEAIKEAMIEERGQLLNGKIMDRAYQEVSSKMDGQISALVLLMPEVREVETETLADEKHNVHTVNLWVSLENDITGRDIQENREKSENVPVLPDKANRADTEETANKIKRIISGFYGFQDVKVNITIREE